MEISRERIARLSAHQRDMLIDHIDGRVALVKADRHLSRTRDTLIDAKLLCGLPFRTSRPQFTALTDLGRQAVCVILGECADMLVRAGFLEEGQRPIDVLARMKARSTLQNAAVTALQEAQFIVDG